MELKTTYIKTFFFWISLFALPGCNKLVEIAEPKSAIPSSRVFSSDGVATQAMSAIYYYLVNNSSVTFGRGAMTIYPGLSADELVLYDLTNTQALDFYQNKILSANFQLKPLLWEAPFSTLYQTNAVIEGVSNSRLISDSVKKELLAEAKFVRAFVNFGLVNLYGDIPYLDNPDWRKNRLLSRLPASQVYQHIIADLKEAQSLLPDNYSVAKGQRIVPNKFAATALLARVYLYLGDWQNAEAQATSVVQSGLYKIVPFLNDVFKSNSSEAIWQLQQDNQLFSWNATGEGITLIPRNSPVIPFPPFAYISSALMNAFDTADKRRTSWISSKAINGTVYYYPYKYKIGPSQAVANGAYSEYYMVLRIAEQYLIRAEARAQLNKLAEAVNDINVTRGRAGLPALSGMLTQQQVLDNVIQERRLELFAEWGHRWLDLKRWRKADAVLAPMKGGNWKPEAVFYPIPESEIMVDPNLTQNPGY